ncbi:patatin-like phospholipase family protein [Tenacibaculum sp. IB213877]|uniref:patatin-like phospholipase family protein n=1 Tax=Tenacibaculum sp. IB213877 TaxID=3097351 RepID=UPI002A5ADCF7|nr:patatin-like phospholipase family protein [Tenacibaculum sp. IB213877]MDY0780370.1 patatin-like phospholipase family protein [Tenacibaculum sp. IB213877]
MKKILFVLLLIPHLFWAQKQPKVGLVLSGGGAKGFAHIGVLKELEKAGVEIDYIGGTSMGAIIGGMYAAGYTADQIEQLIDHTDFEAVMQDKIPRRDKPYFQKAYQEKHTISLPINLRRGSIDLPLGLAKGQNALNLLTEIFSPIEDVDDFKKLPIPFYCIATDIETGEEVVLEKGSLPLAIRASASFPTLLNPVEIDGRLLIDGGVVDNFPVNKMIDRGVDIIIGVNVQGKLYNRNELSSVSSILSQIISFQIYDKVDDQINLVNIYIRPKVTDYGVTSFEDKKEILKEGIKAAKAYENVFKNIAKYQKKKKEKREIAIKKGKFLIDRIVIHGNQNYNRNYILGKLQLKEGDSVSYKSISQKINTLTATNNFSRIDYSFKPSFEGKKLELILKEDLVKSYLRLGVHYDHLYESGVLLNYNHKKLLFQNDELSFDFVVGDNIRYDLQYFIDNGFLLSYGMSSRYNSFSSNILFNIQNVDKLNIDYRDFTNRIFAQTTVDKKFAFVMGLEHKNLKVSSETILTSNNNETYFEKANYINSYASLILDTFDKGIFPNKGFYADIGFKWYMWSDRNKELNNLADDSLPFSQFSQVGGSISFAFTFWDRLTFQYISDAGYTIGKEESQVFDYRLGGYNQNYINNFIPFYGYDIATLTNQSFLKSEFDFRYRVFDRNYISFLANYARIEEDVFDGGNLFENTKSGYGIGYGIETLLGPIELKYTWSPDHNEKTVLFNLGFWF